LEEIEKASKTLAKEICSAAGHIFMDASMPMMRQRKKTIEVNSKAKVK